MLMGGLTLKFLFHLSLLWAFLGVVFAATAADCLRVQMISANTDARLIPVVSSGAFILISLAAGYIL